MLVGFQNCLSLSNINNLSLILFKFKFLVDPNNSILRNGGYYFRT